MSKDKKEPALRAPTENIVLTSTSYGITLKKVKTGDRTETKVFLNTIKYNVDNNMVGSLQSVEVEDVAYALAKIDYELLTELQIGQ